MTDLPTGALYVRSHKDRPYYEGKWRWQGRQVGRRIGPAWVVPDGDGGWKKRRGRVQSGFYDEQRAYVRLADLIAEHAEQAYTSRSRSKATFDDAVSEWLDHLSHGGRAKPSTLADYRHLLEKPRPAKRGKGETKARIMRGFSGRKLADITTPDVARFLSTLDREGLSPRNTNKHREVLHSIFAYACRPETFGLSANPVTDTEKRRQDGPGAIETFTSEELAAIDRAALAGAHRSEPKYDVGESVRSEWQRMNEQDAAMFIVAALTGLRQGELRALKWRHIDFAEHRITVDSAVSGDEISTTKSRRVRVVPLTDEAARKLEALSRRENFTGRNDLVFCSADGSFLDRSALRDRFTRVQQAAGIRVRRFHDLRHTFGSRAVRSFNPVEVKQMMGHSNLTITERYLHARPRSDDARRLAEAFADEPVQLGVEV